MLFVFCFLCLCVLLCVVAVCWCVCCSVLLLCCWCVCVCVRVCVVGVFKAPPPDPPPPDPPPPDRPPPDRPPPDRPKFPPIFILFSLSCWSFSLNFGGVFEDRDPQMCTFGVLGLSCARPHNDTKKWPKLDWPKLDWPKLALAKIGFGQNHDGQKWIGQSWSLPPRLLSQTSDASRVVAIVKRLPLLEGMVIGMCSLLTSMRDLGSQPVRRNCSASRSKAEPSLQSGSGWNHRRV